MSYLFKNCRLLKKAIFIDQLAFLNLSLMSNIVLKSVTPISVYVIPIFIKYLEKKKMFFSLVIKSQKLKQYNTIYKR